MPALALLAAASVLSPGAAVPLQQLQKDWRLDPWELPSISIQPDHARLTFEAPGRAPTQIRLGPSHTDAPYSVRCTGPDCDPLRAEVVALLPRYVPTSPWADPKTTERQDDGRRPPTPGNPWVVWSFLGLAVVGVGVAGWAASLPMEERPAGP
jgi:hypothetical protein